MSGQVRFKSAASYNVEGYNIAIKDDELSIEHTLKGLRIETKDGTVIPVIRNKITAHAVADYYVSCFSANFDFKLFSLFESDACVIITDSDKFVKYVKQEYVRRLQNHHISFGAVEYIDPYRQLKGRRPIEFRKSVNYSYENEWRFVSFPECESEGIEPEFTVKVDRNMFDYQVIQTGDA